MKGVKIKHKRLAAKMREARIKAGLTLQSAAAILGVGHPYLVLCESGEVQYMPSYLVRACELFDVSLKEAEKLALEDYKDSLKQFFKDAA